MSVTTWSEGGDVWTGLDSWDEVSANSRSRGAGLCWCSKGVSDTRSVSEERGEGVVSLAKASLLPGSGVCVALPGAFPAFIFSFALLF